MANAYQIHNSEFDCVHEAAVVHPMATVVSAALALAEREGDVRGTDLITALALGVDVACHIGVASKSPLQFFRPATAGGFGATAAVGKLMGFDTKTMVNAMGVVYSQMCGTMQAHAEAPILLGMQMGFNARNSVIACDMAARGLAGTENVLEGPFGYYKLFEGDYDLTTVLANLGTVWRVAEVSHKPFPSGRATHGIVDAVMSLRNKHGFAAEDVEKVTARVPPAGPPPREPSAQGRSGAKLRSPLRDLRRLEGALAGHGRYRRFPATGAKRSGNPRAGPPVHARSGRQSGRQRLSSGYGYGGT